MVQDHSFFCFCNCMRFDGWASWRMYTDLRYWNWIEKVPERYRPFVYLVRLDRPIGIWLLLLPSLWGIFLASSQLSGFTFQTVYLVILFSLGAVVMRSAGCVINDLWDRKLDAQVERTCVRPLASGEISVIEALVFLTGLLFVGFCILLLMNGPTIFLGLFTIPLIVLYPFTKRITFWPQAVLGLTFNFGALMGWSAVMGSIGLPSVLLYLGAVFWTLGYDTIYAHQDKDDDSMVGIKSTALKFGEDSKKWVGGFYVCALVCFSLAFALSAVNLFALPGLALIAAHVFWQIISWDMDDPDSSLTVFKSNRDIGFLILLVVFVSGF